MTWNAGERDSEICIGAFQPNHSIADGPPRGAIHTFRMALWSAHLYVSETGDLSPKEAPWDCFPDTIAPVVGAKSGMLPAKLTT